MSVAHVICCNDAVQHVVVGGEKEAEALIEHLAWADFNRNKWHWQMPNKPEEDWYRENYRRRCYWHIHTVPLTTED